MLTTLHRKRNRAQIKIMISKLKNSILFLSNYHFIFKYLIIIFYLISICLLFILFFKNEINNLLFYFNFLSINLFLLIVLFIKLPQFNRRIDFLRLIHSINIQKGKKKLVGLEIGVFNGNYSEKIYNYFKTKFDFHLYLVDPWKTFDGYYYDQNKLEKCYSNVKKKFNRNKKVTILRKTSLEASDDFENESLDFVYIDGNHDYDFVIKDLETWFPKLKSNGVLFGDDYSRAYGVHKAVNEFSFKYNLSVKFSDNFKQFCFIKS